MFMWCFRIMSILWLMFPTTCERILGHVQHKYVPYSHRKDIIYCMCSDSLMVIGVEAVHQLICVPCMHTCTVPWAYLCSMHAYMYSTVGLFVFHACIHVQYRGLNESHEIIVWFWRLVHSLKEEEKALLLKFATGSPRVPASGFASLQVQVPECCPVRNSCACKLPFVELITGTRWTYQIHNVTYLRN